MSIRCMTFVDVQGKLDAVRDETLGARRHADDFDPLSYTHPCAPIEITAVGMPHFH